MKILDKEIKLAVFDLDGTLFDSTNIWHKIDKEFFERRNRELPPDFCDEIAHIGLIKGATMARERYGITESEEEIIKEWQDAALKEYSFNIQLKPGAKEYIQNLYSNGVILTIATANDESLYLPCLKRLKIDVYFKWVMDVKKAGCFKDDVRLYKTISDKFNVSPSETIIYEDILMGLQTAYNGGFLTCGLVDVANEEQVKEKKKYSHIFIKDFTELL